MDRLNFNHLYYFTIIAREGSIKAACRQMGVTQSALSNQLKQLEQTLGKPLFDRKVRKLELNEAGRIVLRYANAIFAQADELVRSVRLPDPEPLTLIRVGVLPSLSKTNIHEFVVPLWKNKSVSVSIVEQRLSELMRDLKDGGLEVVLSDRPTSPSGKHLRSVRLQPRRIVAVGARQFALVVNDFPRSLNGLPLLQLTSHSQIRSDIDFFFEQNGIIPQVVGEADDVALLRIAAEKGIGFSILPRNTVQASLKEGTLIQLGELKGVDSDMWATVKVDGEHSSYLEEIINRFKEKVGP